MIFCGVFLIKLVMGEWRTCTGKVAIVSICVQSFLEMGIYCHFSKFLQFSFPGVVCREFLAILTIGLVPNIALQS